MGRKLAAFWRHAERMGNRFKCKFCKQVFPGGVVRLRAHLSGITGQGIQVCSKVPEDVKSATLLLANNNGPIKKKSKFKTSSSNSDITSPDICDARCNNEVDSSLAKFFEMNDLNRSIVESQSFIDLVNVLIKSGSGYVLPSCSTLENELILSLRKEVEQYVSIARQSWEEIGCTLVFDIWHSEKEKRSFISIMACSGKKAVLLNTFEIPNNNLTASFLEEVVHFVVEYVGADKVIQYFVDDTQCSEEIAKLLTSKCPHVFTTRCVVRELESFFKEVHQEVEWIRATFETAKCLVDAIYKDGALLALMRKYTVGKELKQSPGYDMLESIFEVREDLVKFAESPEWLASGYDLQENGKKAGAIIASEEFWKQGEEVLMALKPLFTILHLDDASDSSFGYLYGLVKVAEEVIAHLQTNKQEKYQKFWSIFETKKNRIIHETHKAAAFLNPAYLCNVTGQEITQMEEGINYIIQKFVAVADREAFVEQAMHYRRTLSDPSELFKTIAAKTSTPCEWWNGFGEKFPILKKHATRILCQPCGSSSYKSGLGAFRANLVKQRGLVPELNDLNVRMNLFLMDKCNADNEEKKKRINFEEFGQQKSTNGSSDAALVEPRHSDDETRLSTTREELPRPKPLKLCFMTVVASPILTGQKVGGYQGCPIHVYLADSATDCAVQDGAPSTLTLSISVLDGDFTNEASTDECRTREYFDRNDLSSDMMPLVTGDLQLTLVQGVGMLGEFSFNYSSRGTRSGKFRLAVKTYTGGSEGIRILEGISNAFVVEDDEVTRTQHPAALEMHLPKDSAIAPMEGWWGPLEQMLGESSSSPGVWNGPIWNYNQLQRSCRSLTQKAATRVKKKALLWRSRSCNLRIKMKRSRSPEPVDKETIVGAEFQCPGQLQTLLRSPLTGNEVFEATGVQLTIRNNVNQQEEDGENGEPKALLEEIDFLNTNSIESPAVTPFGVGVATSGTEPRSIGETSEVQSPKHLSTAWQLSLTGDEVPEPVEALHSISEGGKTVNHEKIEAKLRAWEFEAEEHEWEVSGKYVTPHMFSKTLTVSDTSPNGVFPVLRRYAGDCFPPLDLSQHSPSQELVAKDLHGVAWRFTHIYRGQPRRHLLTTGWSTFINDKKLVAGDAVLFLRGEDGELRLGIRRAIRSKRASTMLFGVQLGSSGTAVGKTYIPKENKSTVELGAFETAEEAAPAARETIGNEVLETAGMQLTIGNNVNQQEDDGDVGEVLVNEEAVAVAVEESVSLSSARSGNSNSIISRKPRTPRPRWTMKLHELFVNTVVLLGGVEKASPKAITQQMNVCGLTTPQVAIHLHMYKQVKQIQELPAMKMGSQDQSLDNEKIGDGLLELHEVSSSVRPYSVNRKDSDEPMATVKGFDFLKNRHLPEASSAVAGGSVIPKWPEGPATTFGLQVGSSGTEVGQFRNSSGFES